MATFLVSNSNASGQGSLAAAIAAAEANGGAYTITFAPNLGTIATPGQFTLRSEITFDGDTNNDGTADVTISGDADNNGTGDHTLFRLESSAKVTFDGLILKKGNGLTAGPAAGAIINHGTATVLNTRFVENRAQGAAGADGGAGLDGSDGTAAAGAIYNAGRLSVSNSSFENNRGVGGAGGKGGNGASGENGGAGGDGGKGGDGASGIINAAGGTVVLAAVQLVGGYAAHGGGGGGGDGGAGTLLGGRGGDGGKAGYVGGLFLNFGGISGSFSRDDTITLGSPILPLGGRGGVGGTAHGPNGSGGDGAAMGFGGLTIGTSGNDTRIGLDGDETICGLGGADRLSGGAGTDELLGGAGDDVLDGGSGDDTLHGEEGNDTLLVSAGREYLNGGDGIDRIDFRAIAGPVTIDLRIAEEQTIATGSVEIVEGTIEDIIGTAGGDMLTGNSAANVLEGAAGNDRLFGVEGNDTLDGGAGADQMTGGLGNDTYRVDNAGDKVFEAAGGGLDTVVSTVSYALAAGQDIEIFAAASVVLTTALNLTGNERAQRITGNNGNNIINGGADADTLFGLGGNDIYVVDNAADIANETGGSGIDTVQSSIGFSLANTARATGAIENLTLTGTAHVNGTGNALANIITGNAGNNILDGGDGNDTLSGGLGADTLIGRAGNDTYVVDNAADIANETGGSGIDTVQSSISYSLADAARAIGAIENLTLTGTAHINGTGNALANVLAGNAGNNILDGGAGNDTLFGGAGNDIYVVDNAADTVNETGGSGSDRVQSSISFSLANTARAIGAIENLTLTGTAHINGAGNALANVIIGNAGNNVLDGGVGADTLLGGAGNDVYVVDNALDTVNETGGSGTDRVQSSITFSLANAARAIGAIENLTLTGTANINGTGNALANVLAGNAGANVLDGGAGADTLFGMGGNDVYVIDNALDTVNETGGSGSDRVQSSITFSLANTARAIGAIENLTLAGTAHINGAGNTLANGIIGNAGNNILDGGAGADTLTGGAGNDSFVFSTTLGATNVDRIADFSVPADTIRLDNAVMAGLGLTLGTLSAAAFARNATGLAADASDRIIYETDTGKLFYDANGSAAGGGVHFATLAVNLALTNVDFLVV